MEKIKVSIIVPIYKVPINFLKKNIEHLVNQTMKEIEIILVDDGSPDNCGQICDEYAKKDSRIKVIHQKNKGLCGARNSGQKVALGKYIMFVDGDDYIENDSLEKMYEMTKQRTYDVISACVMKDYGNKCIINDNADIEARKEYLDAECLFWQKKVLDFNANISTVNAKLYNRQFLVDNKLYHDESLRQGSEGLEFLIRVFAKAKSVIHIKEYIYHYILNDNSITETYNEQNFQLILNCFNKIKQTIIKQDNNKELLQYFYTRLLYVIVTTAISGYFNPNNKEAFKIKKEKYKNFLGNELLKEALKYGNMQKIGYQRKLVLFLIKHNMFHTINLIAKLRKWQKK